MSKKRKGFSKTGFKGGRRRFKHGQENSRIVRLENRVLDYFNKNPGAINVSELRSLLRLDEHIKIDVTHLLDSLTHQGMLKKTGRNRFQLHPKAPIYTGKLVQHPKGFGFIEIDSTAGSSGKFSRDPFISRSHMGNAFHGDDVLIRILNVRRDKRPEGAIISVLSKRPNTICGQLVVRGQEFLVLPDDTRIPFVVKVPPHKKIAELANSYVKVRYDRPDSPKKVLSGEVVEILGEANQIDTLMRLVIDKFDLPHQFSQSALKDASVAQHEEQVPSNRKDIRSIPHITIDGDKAKDFDDAIHVTTTSDGYRLFVSIADVSFYVLPGTELNREAYERGTSVYFPDRVIPMLPESLSNDLCSLVPKEDRLAVTAQLDFDKNGLRTSEKYYRSLINSKKRFTYTEVAALLKETSEAPNTEDMDFLPQLLQAEQLATLLEKKRTERGSIGFETQEPEFTLTKEGHVKTITVTKRNRAHKIIEEFMLAANEAVASFLATQINAPLYRIHEKPEQSKLEEYLLFFKKVGIALPPFANIPSWFATVVSKAKNSRFEYIINNLLLRSLTQARYATLEEGHFGLASDAYCHFTSPIRRYPDLIVHRQLIEVLEQKKTSPLAQNTPVKLERAAEFLSQRERIAVNAERDIHNRLKIDYMQDKIGQTFSAIISGVTENTLFIDLEELCISGAIPVDFLSDDYYLHDAANFRLFGEITMKTYQLGDRISAKLFEINRNKQLLTFIPTESNKTGEHPAPIT